MRNAPRPVRGSFTRGALLMIAFAAVCVLVPGLFWWGTTFTRELDDSELVERLADGASPRELQHGIEELSRRFADGRPGLDRWADDLVRVSRHSKEAVRISAAWCMQFDAPRDAFRERLHEMVADDASPMVRRNAATSLAKSSDAAALPALRSMLEPFLVTAEVGGVAEDLATIDQPVQQGSTLGRVITSDGSVVDVRAPVPGAVDDVLVEDGATVSPADGLLRLRPAAEHLKNALLGLALVGEKDDLARIRSAADPRSGYPDDVRSAAAWAAGQLAERLGID